MPREKRTKPCCNCKKSKVKCIYTENLPCERCLKTGQVSTCQLVPKLPTLKLPVIRSHNSSPVPIPNSSDIRLPPISIYGSNQIPNTTKDHIIEHNIQFQQKVQDKQEHWKNQMETQMNKFDNKINDLVDVMKFNQKLMLESQELYQRQMSQLVQINDQNNRYIQNFQQHIDQEIHKQNTLNNKNESLNDIRQQQIEYEENSSKRKLLENIESVPYKKMKSVNSNEHIINKKENFPEDFRNGFLSKQQAKDLLSFFDANISPQLFGFEISKFDVDVIWETSPILICAISTIASMHHPNTVLHEKSKQLHTYLQILCGKLLYRKPQNVIDGFNTIVALILCSFWLSDSQMFTGLALQIAKEIRLDCPHFGSKSSPLSERDRLKLWYLMYALDGQQSLTFNRKPLVNSDDYSLKHSREFLLENKGNLLAYNTAEAPFFESSNTSENNNDNSNEEVAKRNHIQRLTDMRLVSQVEYNQALNEAFSGNAWDLLAPSSFGIPSRSNLELDKWMVSWTVLLAPRDDGTVWSSKSTLIYYNFAKMHINSGAVRQLKMSAADENDMLPKWNNSIQKKLAGPKKLSSVNENLESEDSSDDDDDEFISNKELLSDNETVVSATIAVNAAQTILNLVLNDKDIINNLKYVPVHIHIMLYYAALLLINPPIESNNKSEEIQPEQYYRKVIENMKLVKSLQNRIYLNLPADKNFGDKLIKSLDEVVDEKALKLKEEINDPETSISSEVKKELFDLLSDIRAIQLSDNIFIIEEGPERIAAWPGSHHGHP